MAWWISPNPPVQTINRSDGARRINFDNAQSPRKQVSPAAQLRPAPPCMDSLYLLFSTLLKCSFNRLNASPPCKSSRQAKRFIIKLRDIWEYRAKPALLFFWGVQPNLLNYFQALRIIQQSGRAANKKSPPRSKACLRHFCLPKISRKKIWNWAHLSISILNIKRFLSHFYN